MTLFIRKKESEAGARKNHGCLWTIIVCTLLYIGLGVVFGLMFGSMFSDEQAEIKKNTVYRLQMKGVLVEQGRDTDPMAMLMGEIYGRESQDYVGLDDLLDNIRLAKEDDRVQGILLDGGELQMGQASAKALRDALLDFKESGKWILAYAPSYGQTNYYVASVADRICLNPTGTVNWNGLSAQKQYYTRALEKIGVKVQILKVGTFKSAVEPYFCTSMSDADRKQTEQYLDGIWMVQRNAVSESRHLTHSRLDSLADRYMGLQDAQEYVACGLIDTLIYRQSVDTLLHELVGDKPHKLTTAQMATVERKKESSKNHIAVVYAEGEITDNSGDGIVGTRMVRTLGKVLHDEDVKAVVLRVNSPGGSADASEQIWHAVQLLREKGLPVVVSMGDYAASGGYYISCGSDYIFAQPNTLTGSIGIFGMVPNVSAIADRVGIDIDGVSTHRYSSLESDLIFRGDNAEQLALMQRMVERGYDLFTGRCAEGRHMPQDSIKRIGEGRVWLGADALDLGLVDQLGNMDDAVSKAANLAGLGDDYRIVTFPEQKDFITQLLESLNNSSEEERLLMRLRTLCSKPRIMARMEDVTIQ